MSEPLLLCDYCADVDELLLQIADYKNDLAAVAAEKLFRKCSTSWEADQYLQDRAHESWLLDSARQQVLRIINRFKAQPQQSHEFGYAFELSPAQTSRVSRPKGCMLSALRLQTQS